MSPLPSIGPDPPAVQVLLAIYLNDHLAGSTVGRDLSRRSADSNRGTSYEPFLSQLAGEIDEDRRSLLAIMDALGVRVDRFKAAAAWGAEKLGRLKLNGQLRGYSPLSRVVELEGLVLGVYGKRALWITLASSPATVPCSSPTSSRGSERALRASWRGWRPTASRPSRTRWGRAANRLRPFPAISLAPSADRAPPRGGNSLRRGPPGPLDGRDDSRSARSSAGPSASILRVRHSRAARSRSICARRGPSAGYRSPDASASRRRRLTTERPADARASAGRLLLLDRCDAPLGGPSVAIAFQGAASPT